MSVDKAREPASASVALGFALRSAETGAVVALGLAGGSLQPAVRSTRGGEGGVGAVVRFGSSSAGGIQAPVTSIRPGRCAGNSGAVASGSFGAGVQAPPAFALEGGSGVGPGLRTAVSADGAVFFGVVSAVDGLALSPSPRIAAAPGGAWGSAGTVRANLRPHLGHRGVKRPGLGSLRAMPC